MKSQPQSAEERKFYRAGEVTVDPHARELIVSGQIVPLERRAFDLLVYLLDRRDRVVDKDELWRNVWHGRPVSDSVIPRAVSKLRKALGDSAEEWIVTVHAVGYRLAVPVEVLDGETVDATRPARRPRWKRPAAIGLGTALFTGLVLTFLLIKDQGQTGQPITTIAVLPVQVESGEGQLTWARLGLLPVMEQVIAARGAATVDSAAVVAALRRNPQAGSPADQARVLQLNTGAQRVLLPRLQSSGGRYRLTLAGVDETRPLEISVAGSDPVLMAVNAGEELARSLSAGGRRSARGFQRLVTDDPFVNEAYARGLDARLKSQWQQARSFFETVLSTAPDLHWARYQLSLVTRRLGDWQRTRALNEQLLQAARETGDRELEGSVQNTSGTLAWRQGDTSKAREWYEAARDTFSETGSTHSLAGTYGNLAILASVRGDFDDAEQLYESAASTYRDRGDDYNLSAVLKNMGVMNLDRGRLELAQSLLNESLAIRQRLGLRREASLNLSALSDIEVRMGRWEEARAFQQGVLETARELADRIAECQALADLAVVNRLSGQQRRARTLASESLYLAREIGNPAGEVLALMELARANRELGDAARARELASSARAMYRELNSGLGEVSATLLLAQIALDQHDFDRASRLLDASEMPESAQGNPVHALIRDRARARLDQKNGETERALTSWASIVRRARTGNNPYQRVLTEAQACLAGLTRDDIIEALEQSAVPLAAPNRCLANYSAARGDALRARNLAVQWRRAAGDRWVATDQMLFERLIEEQ